MPEWLFNTTDLDSQVNSFKKCKRCQEGYKKHGYRVDRCVMDGDRMSKKELYWSAQWLLLSLRVKFCEEKRKKKPIFLLTELDASLICERERECAQELKPVHATRSLPVEPHFVEMLFPILKRDQVR